MDLGLIGVWSGALRGAERSAVLDAAAEIEDLGYGTIWFPAAGHERQALGPGKVVAPEQMVVLEPDPARARALARPAIDMYLHAPNYTNNLLRLGFEEADFQNGGSDRVVDAIVAHGDAETVMQRVNEHLAAGADHVCIQVLTADRATIPMDGFRQLARVLPR
jgi:probable F420-dependent oxidoreductase